MNHKRRAARAAFDRYQAAIKPTAALVHELLGAVAAMVAADTGRTVSFIVDGYPIRRGDQQVHSRHV